MGLMTFRANSSSSLMKKCETFDGGSQRAKKKIKEREKLEWGSASVETRFDVEN